MTSNEIREKFLKFFENRGHKIIPSSSLIPDDQSVLFTTAGMQQFKPYYTNPNSAEKDFGSKNVVTIQKCVRTGDIDEVGDNTHLTFFEMLGNFSFGGYGRKEAIEYAYEFITKEMGLEISYVTIFKGLGSIKKDEESEKIWKSLGVTNIHEEGMEDLFWGPTGDSGPCGPTTEIYCKNASGEDVEIWNIVFNEYISNVSHEELLQGPKGKGYLTELSILGIDTGMGLERLVSIVQNKESVYDTDLFDNEKTKEERIISDHIRASEHLIKDGVLPSNTGAGYVLRRLIRRAVRFSKKSLNTENKEIKHEEEKFNETLKKGLKKIQELFKKEDDINTFALNDNILFDLYQSDGFPVELSIEEINKERGNRGLPQMDNKSKEQYIKSFKNKLKEHQNLSRTSSAGMFKGGLANHNEGTIKLHTAHHLLLAGLQEIVSKDIKQKGSNITEERLRMDFICDHKLTDEEKQKVEDWVNDKIQRGLKMVHREMPLAQAEKIGAQMEFGTKYPDTVSVYFIEDENGNAISKEFCGGPHVSNISELGANPDGTPKHFKIQKEEAIASGVRRIKAVLE